ncbi:MAG: hypothetical protein SVZ03_03230 [Spirochaetota bacterium]|nr:hypothetical protein [Spirochaetota bacterium]
MKKIAICFVVSLLFITLSPIMANLGNDIIDKIKPTESDIPNGFMYGIIPDYARKILKENPWAMDKNAIKKLTDKIYPQGDYKKISKIHMTIMAKKETPHGDDIVCYIIQFRDRASAKVEIEKLAEFVEFNKDRSIVVTKENMVVYLHVDDVENFHIIRKMSKKIEKNLTGLIKK